MFVRRIQFNDGEGLDFNDLNNLQDRAHANIVDKLVCGDARYHATDTNPSTSYCYVPGAAQGYPRVNGSAKVVTNVAGAIGQWVTAGQSSGLTPYFNAYDLAADELLTTLNNSDATNPRWDGIFVKIDTTDEDVQSRDFQDATTLVLSTTTPTKRRRTQITKTYTAGTPAALPSLPATPSGFVPWCYVYVPAAYSSAAAPLPEHLNDVRMPMRFAVSRILPREFVNLSTYTLNAAGDLVSGLNGSAWGVFRHGAGARILSVNIYGTFNTGGGGAAAAAWQRKNMAASNSFAIDAWFQSGANMNNPSSNFASDLAKSSNFQTIAVWGNGYGAGLATFEQGTAAYAGKAFAVQVADNNVNSQSFGLIEVFYAF